jgi:hypothetical protein
VGVENDRNALPGGTMQADARIRDAWLASGAPAADLAAGPADPFGVVSLTWDEVMQSLV